MRGASDPAAGHAHWVRERSALVATHPASPIPAHRRAEAAPLLHAPYDPEFRFEARIDPDVDVARMEVPTGTDGVVPFELVGRVRLPVGDLDVWRLASYGGGLFVPLKDASAGRSTYGGGRYLLDTVKGADLGSGGAAGSIVVDLNFAYNPSCAYDPSWACPLAQPGNTVLAALDVGELTPR